MDIPQEQFERFEAYWSGEMPEAERQQLEIDLLIDPLLQRAFNEYACVRNGLNQLARSDVHKQLNALDRQLDNPPHVNPRIRPPYKHVALFSLALAACLALVWFFYPGGYSVQDLPHEEGIPLYMDETADREFDSAMSVFRSVDYAQAARAFSGLPDMEQNDTVLFYLANAELRSGNAAIALRHFGSLTKWRTSVFYDKARYYTAMALWSGGNERDASTILRQIAKEVKHPYRRQAQAALEKME